MCTPSLHTKEAETMNWLTDPRTVNVKDFLSPMPLNDRILGSTVISKPCGAEIIAVYVDAEDATLVRVLVKY